jgi:hypothetical protein
VKPPNYIEKPKVPDKVSFFFVISFFSHTQRARARTFAEWKVKPAATSLVVARFEDH